MNQRIRPLKFLLLTIALAASLHAHAQAPGGWRLLEPADTFNKARFWPVTGAGVAIYGIAAVGLYQAWYKDYPIGKFRLFDDRKEWERMDKMGHLITTYTESFLVAKGARWTGIRQKPAAWIGAGAGMLLQSTVEVMDGFSERWGFSLADMGYNALGASVFLSQELLWKEQRITLKISNTRPDYPDEVLRSRNGATVTVREVAYDRFGKSFLEAFLKDYNGITVWASVNPAAFLNLREESRFPRWLNVAFGYGANNIFGAYGNGWDDPQGNYFNLQHYPRYRQYYLSLDVDLRRIPTRSRVLKTLFTTLGWLKVPAPALEWNSLGETRLIPIFW